MTFCLTVGWITVEVLAVSKNLYHLRCSVRGRRLHWTTWHLL